MKRACLLIRKRLFERTRSTLVGADLRVFVLPDDRLRDVPILGDEDWYFGEDLAETFSAMGAREVLV